MHFELPIALLHATLILFNLFGWIPIRTLRLHLIVILSTFASWLLLGLFYGIGYCPLTDWQWDIKRAAGETDLPPSFIEYYLEAITRLDWSSGLVDTLTLVGALLALVASIVRNLRVGRRGLRERAEE